jgi:hypothetical protein
MVSGAHCIDINTYVHVHINNTFEFKMEVILFFYGNRHVLNLFMGRRWVIKNT